MKKLNIVVIGGVAGGASAATKARRMNEHAAITIFEKGPYISFANCGLPYYISGEIIKKEKLILQTPQAFKNRFNIDVHINHDVVSVDRAKKVMTVKKTDTGESFESPYDKLILAPGAVSFMPPIPGLDGKNIFQLRTVPDAEEIFNHINRNSPQKAIVLGGGYIGLETAEALHRRGMDVTIVEMLPQVLTLLDRDMVEFVQQHIKETGIELILGDAVREISKDEKGNVKHIMLQSGRSLEGDIVVASLGVRPNVKLAKEMGLEIGKSGAIKVNERMETSAPDIYAAGDAVESFNLVTRKWVWTALAGPANKQGRVAGANAAGGNLTFKGVLGTAIVRFGKIVTGKTGLSERDAEAAGYDYYVTTTHSMSHAGYYPGGEMLHVKIVAERKTGKFLGAQVIGHDGVDKRIDVFSTALYFCATVEDLANLDLAYAPPFGSAKDPVNISGMTAQNRLMGIEDSITFKELYQHRDEYNLIDVRTSAENQAGTIEGAILKPVDGFRNIVETIPKDKPVAVYCKAGYRGYLAQRILKQNGFKVKNIDGGYLMAR